MHSQVQTCANQERGKSSRPLWTSGTARINGPVVSRPRGQTYLMRGRNTGNTQQVNRKNLNTLTSFIPGSFDHGASSSRHACPTGNVAPAPSTTGLKAPGTHDQRRMLHGCRLVTAPPSPPYNVLVRYVELHQDVANTDFGLQSGFSLHPILAPHRGTVSFSLCGVIPFKKF